MLLEDERSQSPRSDAPQHCIDRVPFRGRMQRHLNSWQTEECMNPVRGYRDWQRRNGIQPHNHHRDNLTAIRSQSIANRQQKQRDVEVAAKALPPFTPQISARSSAPTVLPRDERRPGEKDYVYRNALATRAASVTARARRYSSGDDKGERWLRKQDFGAVPSYLQTRKAELARQHAETQTKKLEDLVPPGVRIMPEAERLEMLEMLQKGKADVEQKLQALPFVIETLSQKQRAEALHKRLEEIEEATTIFSRQTVLVEQ